MLSFQDGTIINRVEKQLKGPMGLPSMLRFETEKNDISIA